MRRLISLFLLGMFFVPCAMAASTVSVRVSFTIPERIETCDNNKAQAQTQTNVDATPAPEQTAIATMSNLIVRADRVCLMQTTLPR